MSGGQQTSSVIARVEADLRNMWATPPRPSEPPKSRVCTMNLVVIANSQELADRYTPVVDEVTGSIPARAIIVAIEPESAENLFEGDAAAICSTEGPRNICSERVRLRMTGQVCARLGSAVDSLRVPELPTSVVWLGPVHTEDPIFESVANDAARIILDTEYTSMASLLRVTRLARGKAERPHVADIAWTRIAPWQELTARFFDDANHRDFASQVMQLHLKQAAAPKSRLGSEGALYLGWIATRLGWRVSRMGGALRFTRADGKPVAVNLASAARPDGVAPSVLADVSLEAGDGGPRLVGRIHRELGSGPSAANVDADVVKWSVQVGGAAPIEHQVRLGANKGAKWLERTLHRPPNDPALMDAVAFAEQILQDDLICE